MKLRHCVICESPYFEQVAELMKQGYSNTAIREWLWLKDVDVFENSIRWHLLNHPDKLTWGTYQIEQSQPERTKPKVVEQPSKPIVFKFDKSYLLRASNFLIFLQQHFKRISAKDATKQLEDKSQSFQTIQTEHDLIAEEVAKQVSKNEDGKFIIVTKRPIPDFVVVTKEGRVIAGEMENNVDSDDITKKLNAKIENYKNASGYDEMQFWIHDKGKVHWIATTKF